MIKRSIYFVSHRFSTSRTTQQTTKRIYTDATDYVATKQFKSDGDNILDTAGVVDPRTGRILTVGEAIQMRILDVRTGEIVIYNPNGGELERITLEDAIKRKLIDTTLANNLLKPGAANVAGRSISLLEVIQKEILDAENGYDSTEKRIKVITTTTDKSAKLSNAQNVRDVGGEHDNNDNDGGDGGSGQSGAISIADAIQDGIVDAKTGLYRTQTGTLITISEAVRMGYLVQTETVKIKSNELCLSDAIVHGLVDTSGWVIDRNSGDKFRLDSAIANGLITPNVREVVDARNDIKITLQQALDNGILNAKTGRYMQNVTKEKLTFIEAKNRQLVGKPITLKDVCDLNLLEKNGKIISPTRKSKLNILEAIHAGVLDSDTIRSITKTKDERLTLSEALAEGIILPDSLYCDAITQEEMSIPEAVDRGLISSVSQRSIFNIDGFKDPFSGDFVSLNVAIQKNILRKKDGEYQLDAGKNQLQSLVHAVESGLVRPEVCEMLNRQIGIFDATGKQLTVLDLVYYDLIDPKSGYLLHPKTKAIVPLDQAIESKLITPDGALLLSSLLNITLTTETVTKTIRRYVTITDQQSADVSDTKKILTFTEAVGLGYFDENRQMYTNPDTGKTYSIQQALNHGLIAPDSDSTHIPIPAKRSTITIVHKSVIPEQLDEQIEKMVEESIPTVKTHVVKQTDHESVTPMEYSTFHTETKIERKLDTKVITTDFINTERQIIPQITEKMLEVPPDGWLLSAAIEQKLFDPNTGLFDISATDRQVSFEECIKLAIINPLSASVIDPSNNRKMTVKRSFEKRILDATGNYKKKNQSVIGMKQALDEGYIILENPNTVPSSPERFIQLARQPGKPDVLEISEKISIAQDPTTTTTTTTIIQTKSSSQDIPSPEPIQLVPGIIYDPSTALVIFTETGYSDNIVSAVANGTVDGSSVRIVNPNTGSQLTIQEAIAQNIVDEKTSDIKDGSGKTIDIIDAVKLGILTVIGSPLVAAAGAINSIKLVFDPQTGHQIPYEIAYERGLVTKEELLSVYPDSPSHTRTLELESIAIDDETLPCQSEQPRIRVTVEPKYKVSIGRARSVQSPEKEGRPVILQKMRKKIVTPKDALSNGLIDQVTADLLDNKETFQDENGELQTLADAVAQNKIDGNSGRIVDPQRGDILTLNQAIERGILDADGTNQILVPLNRSLSIVQLKDQGLIDTDSFKIVHPETGMSLSLREAIICEIVDPLSKMYAPNANDTTLQVAIDNGTIDVDRSLVHGRSKYLDLLAAIDENIFVHDASKPIEKHHSLDDLPLLGMTFPVAVKRGLVNTDRKDIIHPITGDRTSILQAIDNNFIMALPYTPNIDGVQISAALEADLINTKQATFKNVKYDEFIPLNEAVETGLLIIKPLPELIALHSSGPHTSVTETVTSYHTITTKTLELLCGYALISPNQVQSAQTGEIISVEEAKLKGIIKDESNTSAQFATREIKVNFTDAVRRGLVDIKAGTYTDPTSGQIMSIHQAVQDGILETDDSSNNESDTSNEIRSLTLTDEVEIIPNKNSQQSIDPKRPQRINAPTEGTVEDIVDARVAIDDAKPSTTSRKISVKKAAKMGLMAVVGAPVLAGMAVADAVKKATKKKDKKEKPIPQERSIVVETKPIITETITSETVETKPKTASIEIVSTTIETPSQTIVGEQSQAPLPEKRVTFDTKTITHTDIVEEEPKIIPEIKLTPDNEQKTIVDTVRVGSVDPQYAVVLEYDNGALTESTRRPLRITENLQPDDLIQYGAFDANTGSFLNPYTQEPVPFHAFVNELNIFDPANIYIKDLSEDVYEPFDVALEKPLIDKNTGHMVDSKSGQRVPFFECAHRRWILEQIPEEDEDDYEGHESVGSPTDENVEINLEPKSVANAIQTGNIRIERLLIKDPVTDEVLPMNLAVDRGIVDLRKGVVVNSETKQEIQFSLALEEGLLFAGKQPPLSLEAIVRQELYDPVNGTITDLNKTNTYDIKTAIDSGIINPEISLIKDSTSNKIVPLDDALNKQLVLYTGHVKRGTDNLPLNVALAEGLILTKPIHWDLLEVLIKQYYSSKTGLFLSPITGDRLTLNDAIKSGWINTANVLVKDDETDNIIPVNEAIASGLIDTDRGIITRPELPLDDALNKGYLISTSKPYSLVDLIIRRLYDPMTGLLNIDGAQVTVEDALKNGLVHTTDMIVKDPRNGEIITLLEAIRRGIVDPRAGIAIDPRSGLKLTLIDAYERGILLQSKRKCTLPDAVFKGIYDPQSGKFSTSVASEKMSTERAIRRGIIDAQSTIVNTKGKVLPFELAVESGIVDIRRGTVADDYGDKIDFREAFDRGILIEVKKPISLCETLLKGLYDEETGLFMDPKSGRRLTISQSLARNLIDPNSVQMKEPGTGLYKPISLVEATKTGLIDGENALILFNSKRITLKEAFDLGLLCDTNAPVSLQRAIHQGLYESKTGKIYDSKSGRKITLLEAMRKFLINPQLPCYFNESDEKLLSLADTCRARLIDRREGVFKEDFSDVFIPLNEAMDLGLIVDIENGSFGLYETIAMRLYDRHTKQIIHPVNNRKISLRQACAEDLVSPILSLVKDTTTNKYVKLNDAIQAHIIDDQEGLYILPTYVIDLYEARKRGLIVTNQKLLSIEKTIRMQLYRPDNGKFTDPSTNTFHNLLESIDNGLIDSDTTVFKNPLTGQDKSLRKAIADGDIDVIRGRVLDPKSKQSYNYDVALQKGLLVTVIHPITGRGLKRNDSIDSPISPKLKLPRELTLHEAIAYEIISPEKSVVKDPVTSTFKALKHFLPTANAELRALIDPKSLFFVFDPTFIVYNREPLSFDYAVQSKKLNLSTGKFVDAHDSNKEYGLKDAVGLGLIDPESALVKDGAKKKLVRLPEAYRKGLIDGDKANVVDTTTSKLYPLHVAYDTGLLITPKRSFSLLEAITYKLYNPTTGGLTDPFISTSIIERKRLTLNDAIASGLVDPTTTVVRDTANSTIVPLVSAIALGLVDPIAGRLNKNDNENIDLVKAHEKGFLLPAEQRVSFHYHRHNDKFIIQLLLLLLINFFRFIFLNFHKTKLKCISLFALLQFYIIFLNSCFFFNQK